MTIDVILRNGQLKVNDRIILCALGMRRFIYRSHTRTHIHSHTHTHTHSNIDLHNRRWGCGYSNQNTPPPLTNGGNARQKHVCIPPPSLSSLPPSLPLSSTFFSLYLFQAFFLFLSLSLSLSRIYTFLWTVQPPSFFLFLQSLSLFIYLGLSNISCISSLLSLSLFLFLSVIPNLSQSLPHWESRSLQPIWKV